MIKQEHQTEDTPLKARDVEHLTDDDLLEALDSAIEDMYSLSDTMYEFQETGVIPDEQWDFYNPAEYESIGNVLEIIKDRIRKTKKRLKFKQRA
jgi:hypothetical protein